MVGGFLGIRSESFSRFICTICQTILVRGFWPRHFKNIVSYLYGVCYIIHRIISVCSHSGYFSWSGAAQGQMGQSESIFRELILGKASCGGKVGQVQSVFREFIPEKASRGRKMGQDQSVFRDLSQKMQAAGVKWDKSKVFSANLSPKCKPRRQNGTNPKPIPQTYPRKGKPRG